MTRCVLHAGMFKTGTTSIQRSLHGYADERFVYADFDPHPNHAPALFGLLGHDNPRATRLDDEGRKTALARFRQSMAAARGRTCLISGEGVVLLPPDKLRLLRDHLREAFDEITVAAAIRAPAGFVAGMFQEQVKRQRRDERPSLQYRGYRAIFRKFDDVFGGGHVMLWKFDPASYPGGCAVRDFCHRFDIALPASRIVRLNESLSREALGLLYIYRELGRDLGSTSMTGPQNHRLASELMRIGNTRFRLSRDLIGPVLEQNRADIEWMEARLGQSLDEHLGKHQPGEVRDLAELLVPDPQAVNGLIALLGNAAPAGNRGETPRDVALLVHALRTRTDPPPSGSLRRLAYGLLDRARARTGTLLRGEDRQ